MNILKLAQLKVLDQDKNIVPVASFWRDQTAIIIFLRHFGCISCRTHAKEVWQRRHDYEKSKAKLYFIGNGSPEMITAFKENLGIQDAPIFTDPKLETFHACGFKRGFLNSFGPKSIKNVVKMYMNGHEYEAYTPQKGDLWQLGGVVAIRKDSTLAYHHISEAVGDFPLESDIRATPWISK